MFTNFRPPDPSLISSLNDTLKDIAKLSAEGKTEKEISSILDMTEAAVHDHRKQIFKN